MPSAQQHLGVTHSDFVTHHADEARQFMDDAYGSRLRLSGRLEGEQVRLTRLGTARFSLDRVVLPGTLHFTCDPVDRLVISVTRRGLLGIDCQGRSNRPAPHTPLLTPYGTPYRVISETSTVHVTMLDPGLLHDTLGSAADERAPLRFTAQQATDPAAAELWRAATTFATRRLSGTEAVPALVAQEMGRLLAASVLSLFPREAAEWRAADSRDATPGALRRAVAYIESCADQNITLTDIARAARVSARAVQHAFRRHLDTTPLAFLRRVRLEHAHRALREADPESTTVTRIAAHWGFPHTSRFAARYQETYGQLPHQTLRQAPGGHQDGAASCG